MREWRIHPHAFSSSWRNTGYYSKGSHSIKLLLFSEPQSLFSSCMTDCLLLRLSQYINPLSPQTVTVTSECLNLMCYELLLVFLQRSFAFFRIHIHYLLFVCFFDWFRRAYHSITLITLIIGTIATSECLLPDLRSPIPSFPTTAAMSRRHRRSKVTRYAFNLFVLWTKKDHVSPDLLLQSHVERVKSHVDRS